MIVKSIISTGTAIMLMILGITMRTNGVIKGTIIKGATREIVDTHHGNLKNPHITKTINAR